MKNINQRLSQRIIAVFLCFFMFNVTTVSAESTAKPESVQVYVTDFTFTIGSQSYMTPQNQRGFIYQDRMYVPLRFASYMLEKWVDWDAEKKAVIVSEPTEKQLLQLKQKKESHLTSEVLDKKVRPEKLALPMYSNYGSFIVYGQVQKLPLDVTTILYDGAIYVPLRFFGEVLKHNVHFDAQSKSIKLADSQQSKDQAGGAANTEAETPEKDNNVTPPIAAGGGHGAAITTRESIVTSAEVELNKLKAEYSQRANELAQEYQATNDEDTRKALIVEGVLLQSEADTKVSEVLEHLNRTLQANGYTVGTDSETFNNLYIELKDELKDELIEAFLSN